MRTSWLSCFISLYPLFCRFVWTIVWDFGFPLDLFGLVGVGKVWVSWDFLLVYTPVIAPVFVLGFFSHSDSLWGSLRDSFFIRSGICSGIRFGICFGTAYETRNREIVWLGRDIRLP